VLLTDILSRDLAYRSEIMSVAKAEAWADSILATLFPADAKLMTNLDVLEPSKAPSYSCYFSGTKATFSVGIIAITSRTLALVWVEDED